MANMQPPFSKVIFVFFDDLGYGDVSCNQTTPVLHTPHMDQLASEGIRFTDAHATSAVCTPSRYSLLAGRYNWRTRLKDGVLYGYDPPLLERHRRYLGHLFQDAGFHTACIGKWHLGLDFSNQDDPSLVDYREPLTDTPLDHGFDHFFGISASLDMPPYVYIRDRKWTNPPDRVTSSEGMEFWREGPTGSDFKHEAVLDVLTDHALDYVAEHQGEKFFLYLPLPAPHTPILPAPQFQGKSGLNPYADFVLHCDDVIRRLRHQLEVLGVLDETLFIVSSDNGCSPMADFPALEAKQHFPSGIFRGMKSDLYEGGHRIPLIARCPSLFDPNTVENTPVSLVDLYATLARIFKIELEPDEAEDSFAWPYTKRAPIISQSIDGSLAIRSGDYKLLATQGSGGWSEASDPASQDALQLYHLDADPHEDRNLLHDEPTIVRDLLDQLASAVYDGSTRPSAQGTQDDPIPWPAIADWYRS